RRSTLRALSIRLRGSEDNFGDQLQVSTTSRENLRPQEIGVAAGRKIVGWIGQGVGSRKRREHAQSTRNRVVGMIQGVIHFDSQLQNALSVKCVFLKTAMFQMPKPGV